MAGDIMAGVVVGVALAVCGACVAIAAGGVTMSAVIRATRWLAPRDRRATSRDRCVPAFDCYYHRQRELEIFFSKRLDTQRGIYLDYELVVGVHPWELAIVLDMPQVKEGKLYGRYELICWYEKDCDIVPRPDPRLPQRGNGALSTTPT